MKHELSRNYPSLVLCFKVFIECLFYVMFLMYVSIEYVLNVMFLLYVFIECVFYVMFMLCICLC
jgi:hypothetical protein